MAHLAASLHRLREANRELTLEIERLKADRSAHISADRVEELQADIATLRFEKAELQSENERLQALVEEYQRSRSNSVEASNAIVPHAGHHMRYASSRASTEYQLEVALAPAPDWRLDVDIISAVLAQHDGRFTEQAEQTSSLRASIEEHTNHRHRLDNEIAVLKSADRAQSVGKECDAPHELQTKVKSVVAKLNGRVAALERGLEALEVALSQVRDKESAPKIAELNRLAARTGDLEDFKASIETRLRHEEIIDGASEKDVLLHMFKKLSANILGSDQQIRRVGPFEGNAKEFRRLRQRVLWRIVTFDSILMFSKATELVAGNK